MQLATKAHRIETGAAEFGDDRIGAGLHGGLAIGCLAVNVGHFAKTIPHPQHIEQLALQRDLRLTLGEKVETVAGLAFADHSRTPRYAFPVCTAHQLPQFRVGQLVQQ